MVSGERLPRFVILEHDHPHLHWDLMLEAGDVLRTWRLAEPPAPGKTIAAEALGNHRRTYLDYEGPVSGNRGQVKRWDWGTFAGELTGAEISIRLHGQRLVGVIDLSLETANQWSFQFLDLHHQATA